MKKKIIDRISLTHFSWLGVTESFDHVLGEVIGTYARRADLRMEIYMQVIAALLSSIYCCLLFCDSEDEAEKVYASCITELDRIFEENLSWPSGLDEMVQ